MLARITIATCLCLFLPLSSWGQEKPKTLSKDDEQLLQRLLADFLFDPRGAQRVEIELYEDGNFIASHQGWLVKEKNGERVYFTDGASMPAPPGKRLPRIDFVSRCADALTRWPCSKT
jgi:hypothetical protein